MDPISLTLGVVGLGMSVFGALGQASDAKKIAQVEQQKAQVSMDTAGIEQNQNDLRQQMMGVSARRSQLETIRTAQRARSMAEFAGQTQTGGLQGSGVQAGMGETVAEGTYGLVGISQNLQAGTQMFGYDRQINQNKIRMAQLGGQEASLQGDAATYGGIASLGGALMKAGPTVGNMSKGMNFNFLFGGGSPSGYG